MLPNSDAERIAFEIVTNFKQAAKDVSELAVALSDLKADITAAVAEFAKAESAISDVGEVSKRSNSVIEEMGRRIKEYAKAANTPITSISNTLISLNATDKVYTSLVSKATQYALALEKASLKTSDRQAYNTGKELEDANKLIALEDKRLAKEAERNALEQKRLSQKTAEIEVIRQGEEFERRKHAEETKALATQERKLALENAETQAFREQLAQLQELASADAMRLQAASPYASPVNSPQAALATQKIAEAERQLINTTVPLTNAQKKLGMELKNLETASGGATSGLFSLRNVARTALGTFEAMAIFFLTQLVGQAIKKTIDSISQLEQSLIKLTIAEKAISKAGVDITPQQLSSIIKDVAAAYETVSKIDAAKMVSNLAVLTKDLQLTAKEYRDLAMAIPLVAQQAGVSIDSATEQVINGLTKSGRGWADLGITVDAEIIKQKAVAEGLVATRAEYEALTAEQKQNVEVQALISILLENTNANLEEQSNYLNTIEGQTKSANAQWEDLLSTLGRIARPTTILFLKEINTTLTSMNDWLDTNEKNWNEWSANVAYAVVITSGFVKMMYHPTTTNFFTEIPKLLEEAGNAYREAMGLAKGLDDIGQDTPTGAKEEPQGSLEQDQEDLQKALEKMNDEILEAQLKLAQDLEDAQTDLERKRLDITTEYAKKRTDVEREYASKVADINSDYRNRIAEINSQQAEANQQARNDELEREAKFQEQMRQLKERFLMDLEDALHARDARQVLRLIKQYNLDKAQAEREHALEQETAQREQEERNSKFSRERADAERDRKAKLADAQREYADKLAKLKADEEAERAAAELAYQRKIQDLEREMQNRLEIVAANLIAEFNLTKDGLDAILALYQKYYSEIAGIYAAMNAMLAGQQNLLSGGNKSGGSLLSNKSGKGGSSVRGGFAEGGSMIANKPTTVTFGDNNGEFELATFTPLQHAGKDMNKVFSSVAGGSSDGMGGTLELSLLLSPDLEARITRNTLDSVGQVITKVSRSKR